MIKGIDLLSHPDAEEIVIYDGYDSHQANTMYDRILNESIYNFQTKKRYRILERRYNTKLGGPYVVSFIGELINE